MLIYRVHLPDQPTILIFSFKSNVTNIFNQRINLDCYLFKVRLKVKWRDKAS